MTLLRFLSPWFLITLGLIVPVEANDNAREYEYAQIIQNSPVHTNIVWLESAGQKFLSLYNAAEKNANNNAVLILHDIGAYPDQKPVIFNLRNQLPHHHWATLAIQLPLREANAEQSDYYSLFTETEKRIIAAITYLKSLGTKNVVIIGYGLGALQAIYSFNNTLNIANGLITLSLSVPETEDPKLQTLAFIKNVSVPFLDLYAELDLVNVIETAEQRRIAGKDNPAYWQERIIGADHNYQQEPERLVKRLYSWLNNTYQ